MKVTNLISPPEAIEAILRDHEEWLRDPTKGKQADLSGRDLTRMDFSRRNMRGVKLSGSVLWGVDFTDADLTGAELCNTVLKYAILRGTNLSGAKVLESPIDFISGFQKTPEGIIVYKYFASEMSPPSHWKIEQGAIITETVNPDRGCLARSSGIYVASLEWVKGYLMWLHQRDTWTGVWKCLIRWEWLPGVIVPFYSDGEFRTERLELINELNIMDVYKAPAQRVMYNDLSKEMVERWY